LGNTIHNAFIGIGTRTRCQCWGQIGSRVIATIAEIACGYR
jgi:hypothetical protein